MKPIKIVLPAGSTVVGEILADYSQNTTRLSQDIYQATLPSGVIIDVGWLPRFDPIGEFVITVFRDDFDNPLAPPIHEKSPSKVAKLVVKLAAKHGQAVRPTRVLSGSFSIQK